MIQPTPGAPYLHNLVSTLILHGNSRYELDLNCIAQGTGLSADAIAAEFDRQSSINSLAPSEGGEK